MPGAGGGGDRGCCVAGLGVVVTSVGVGSRGGVVVDAAAHAAGSGVAAHAAACGVATSHAAGCGGAAHVTGAGGAIHVAGAGGAAHVAHGAGVVVQVVGAGAGVAAGGAGVGAGGAGRARCYRGARWSGMRVKVTIVLSYRNCISKDVKFQRALPMSVSHGAPMMTSMLSPMERRKASI